MLSSDQKAIRSLRNDVDLLKKQVKDLQGAVVEMAAGNQAKGSANKKPPVVKKDKSKK